MKKLTFLIISICLILTNLSAQDIVFTFNAIDASNTIDSIKAMKVETGETAFVEGSNTINLSSLTTETKLFPTNPVEISVYPNPFENYTQLLFHSNQNDNIKVSLINAVGQIVAEETQYITRGLHQFNISTKNKGLYILNIAGNQNRFSQKIISTKNSQSINKIEYTGYSSMHPIEKSAKIEEGELIFFFVYSGDNITKIADSPSESKIYEVEFYECKDSDGKSYPIVQIGDQWWTAENLAYLPSVSPKNVLSDTEPRYYIYGYEGTTVAEAKSTENYNKYGVHYNYIASKISCPAGWHLASYNDWQQLAQYVSDSKGPYEFWGDGWNNVGKHLKSTTGWINDGNGTDDFGFTGLPAGAIDLQYHHEDKFYGLGSYSAWWSDLNELDEGTIDRILTAFDDNLVGDELEDVERMSIRCVKNEQSVLNQFMVGSDIYELSKGILEYQGYNEDRNEYGYSIELLSSDIKYEGRENYADDHWPDFEFTGTGNWVSIEFESTINDNITGNYSDAYAFYVTNFNFSNQIEYEVSWESEGIWSENTIQLSIEKLSSSNEYVISFSFADDKGNNVVGYYKGGLEYFDHSD